MNQRLNHLLDNRIGSGAHLVVRRVLDGVRDKDAVHLRQPERDGLRLRRLDERA